MWSEHRQRETGVALGHISSTTTLGCPRWGHLYDDDEAVAYMVLNLGLLRDIALDAGQHNEDIR